MPLHFTYHFEEEHGHKAQNKHKACYSEVDVGTIFDSLMASASCEQGENASQCCKHSSHRLPMTHTHTSIIADLCLAYLTTHDSWSILVRQDSSKAEGGRLEDSRGSIDDEHGDKRHGKKTISPWIRRGLVSEEAQLMQTILTSTDRRPNKAQCQEEQT